MRKIKFFIKFIEYTLPFLGVLITGFGIRLSSLIVPIKEYLSSTLQLELDLAFNILLLYLAKSYFSIKDHTIINSTLLSHEKSNKHLTLERITDVESIPEYVELDVDIFNSHYIKDELYLEIRYARNIEIAIDNKPADLIYRQDHENKNIKITLNSLFNFMLKKPQKATLEIKILSNSTAKSDSWIELLVTANKTVDNLRFKESLEDMSINIT